MGRAVKAEDIQMQWQRQNGMCEVCGTRIPLEDARFRDAQFVRGKVNPVVHKGCVQGARETAATAATTAAIRAKGISLLATWALPVVLWLTVACALPPVASAQTPLVTPGCVSRQIISPPTPAGTGQPAAYASVRVCTPGATGSPCTPLATGLYYDAAETQPITSQPFSADANANFQFCTAPGNYLMQVTPQPGTTYSSTVTVAAGAAGAAGATSTEYVATGPGTPTISCSTSNYGQIYTDYGSAAAYTCTASGWKLTFDPASPGPIGTVTPNVGNFTMLTAQGYYVNGNPVIPNTTIGYNGAGVTLMTKGTSGIPVSLGYAMLDITGSTNCLYADSSGLIHGSGAACSDGNTITGSVSTPSSGIGVNGDYYLVSSTMCLWGPKASGAWPGSATFCPSSGGTINGASVPASAAVLGTNASGQLVAQTTVYTSNEYSLGTCTTSAAVNPANGNRQRITLTQGSTCALTFTQPATGTVSITLKIMQATTSPYNGAISGGRWAGNGGTSSAPSITAASGAVDFVTCYLDGTTAWCQAAQNF